MSRAALASFVLLPAVFPASGRAQAGAVEPFSELGGVIASLLIIVGVILAAAWVARRTPFAAASRRNGPLKLIATLPLGPKERLLLVQADGCEVLIGVSPAGIFPLHRTVHGTAAAPADGEDRALEATSFARVMDSGKLVEGAP